MKTTRKDHPTNVAFEEMAKNMIKSQMKLRGLTYAELADHFNGIGSVMSWRNVSNKINRGGFSASFFLQCMIVMGVTDLTLDHSLVMDALENSEI